MAASGRTQTARRGEIVFPRIARACAVILTTAALCLSLGSSTNTGISELFAASAPGKPAAVNVTLVADGSETQLSTAPITIAELLATARISLGEYDRVEPALDRLVADGMVVRVVRVICERVTREIEIPVETRERYDRRVRRPLTVREGSPGRAVAELEVWTKDGDETARTVLSQRVVEPMQPKVVVRGPMSLPSRGGEVLYMEATGYDPGPRSCGRYASGHTAIGLHAGKGVVAVDPRVIPLGTRLYVEGYGECVAGDVGSAIKGRRIDLGFDTYRQAMVWGRRTVKVQILE
jgi:3D (Asp-Asp-Asp) domain-containing protein